jgi:ligand-binding sensor domain-containing protein
MKQVNSVQAIDNGVWAATGGGGFIYDAKLDSYKSLTKTDGLFSTSLTATCVDNHEKVWFGGSSGDLNVYDPDDNSFRTILDIYNSDKVNKQINEAITFGDTIFLSTEFGLSLIDSKSFVFYDTYYKFGNLSSNIRVSSTAKYNLIYAATDFGIAVQKSGATNLSAPESWNVYNTNNGLPSNIIRKVRSFRDTIIAATDKGLSMFNGTSWQNFLPGFTNVNIFDIHVSNDSLLISYGNNIGLYYQGSLTTIFTSQFDIRKITSSSAGLFVTSSRGVVKVEINNSYKTLVPNGPEANQFPNMITDKTGNLWSASGKDGQGKGVFKFDAAHWNVYDVEHYPELYQNDYYSVYASFDNTIYSGSWGFGFVKIKNDIITRFHSGNSPMIGITDDPAFIVITGFAEDSKNNLWILNLNAADKKSLYMLTPDSVWYSFKNPLEQYLTFSEMKNLTIDQQNTKWYTMTNEGKLGLYYFNDKGTYSETADDIYGYISKTNGLNDNAINSVVLDKRGDLWIGTSLGVNIITNSSSVVSSNPQLRISSVFSLRQQTINCIAVDPLNQKWIGTNQGLILVNSDGSRLIATYDSKNSPLLSDVIRSIAIDENKGIVFVGTDAGLTSFETPSIKPLESFTELFVYPNPLFVENEDEFLTIDGLIKDTEIKILSISGKLINEFSSPGGRVAYWDGKDFDGKSVNSGIYIIVAYDQEGNNVATSKVAVLRKK